MLEPSTQISAFTFPFTELPRPVWPVILPFRKASMFPVPHLSFFPEEASLYVNEKVLLLPAGVQTTVAGEVRPVNVPVPPVLAVSLQPETVSPPVMVPVRLVQVVAAANPGLAS